MRRSLVALLPGLPVVLAALAAPAMAHEVQHRLAATPAVSVTLSYADGKPFAYESYELYAQGRDLPVQVGRTDGAGRVVFVPGGDPRWRLRAFSGDGHGMDLEFDAPAVAAPAPETPAGADRSARVLFGLSALLATFAAYQFLIARKDRRS
jgi:nickel transport protein